MDINNKLFITTETVNDIANAIREKEGSTEQIPGNEFADRILALPLSDKITNSETVEMIAKDQIKIGDTVYAVKEIETLECDFSDGSSFGTVYTATFSSNNELLVLGGEFRGKAKIYSVNGTTITFIDDIYADNEKTELSSEEVDAVAFSPDGSILVLGGYFPGKAKFYSIEDKNVTYISDIYADNNNTIFSGSTVSTITFSPDGTLLILGGISNNAKVYSVNNQMITYLYDIVLDGYIYEAVFSPDGKYLILGGDFSNYAAIYSVNNSEITFLNNIYADNANTSLDNDVSAIIFSPDGKTMILGGKFNGKAKVYSVNDQTITYINDIYKDADLNPLTTYIKTGSFTPDGKTLFLGGYYDNLAKMYSVNGSNIAYNSDIDLGVNTARDPSMKIITISPNGKLMVVGGWFSSYVLVYSLKNEAYLAENGEFTDLEYNYNLGFAKSNAEIGENVTVKTIGKYMIDNEAIINEKIAIVLEGSY